MACPSTRKENACHFHGQLKVKMRRRERKEKKAREWCDCEKALRGWGGVGKKGTFSFVGPVQMRGAWGQRSCE